MIGIRFMIGGVALYWLARWRGAPKPTRREWRAAALPGILMLAGGSVMLLNWLRSRPLLHVDTDLRLTMVHAGLHPRWSLSKAQSLAGEVESKLRSDEHIDFYKHMYGDKPRNWSEELKGWPRLRFITNVMTRLRYCDETGKPRLSAKGAPGTQPRGLYPWFEIKSRRSKKEPVIFGHWSTLALAKDCRFTNVFPLDTGCLWGGALTALRIDKKPFKRISIECPEARAPKARS
jgi:bis(5'-nucleosyl)-tetraphosphatase (symmetrical)